MKSFLKSTLIFITLKLNLISCQDLGEPLFLTPYINSGAIEEAKSLAIIDDGITQGILSYSGFITVNETLGSNLFFWFVPAAYNYETAPVMYWVEGGSGFTGMFSLFNGNGPFDVDKDGNLHLKSQPWSLTHSMIFVDNPVGSGFSFTGNIEGYPTSGLKAIPDMYEFLTQFFKLFPELQLNDFFIGGYSNSGGVFSPALSHHIYKENTEGNPETKINLKGVLLGAPAIADIILQSNWGEALFRVGLIDQTAKQLFDEKYALLVEAWENGDWELAGQLNEEMLYGTNSLFVQETGFDWFAFYNILNDKPSESDYYLVEFLEKPEVRKAIHVGNITFDYVNPTTGEQLGVDKSFSMRPIFEDLISWGEDIKFMIYVGQFDIIVYPHGVDEFVRSLSWNGQQELVSKKRSIWRVDGHVAGYFKNVGNFTHVLIRNTGHDLNLDSPEWAYDLVYKFTRGLSLA